MEITANGSIDMEFRFCYTLVCMLNECLRLGASVALDEG